MVFECLLRNLTTYVTSIVQRCFINVDESHIDRDPTRRYYGRWLKGEPATLWQYASSDGDINEGHIPGGADRSLAACTFVVGLRCKGSESRLQAQVEEQDVAVCIRSFPTVILTPARAREHPVGSAARVGRCRSCCMAPIRGCPCSSAHMFKSVEQEACGSPPCCHSPSDSEQPC